MGALKAAIVPVTAFQQNCTLLWDEAAMTGVVIDPGGDVGRIVAAIEQVAMTVEAIWLTHGHIDHAAGAMELKERTGVDIIGPHEADAPLLSRLEDQARMFAMTETVRDCEPDRFLSAGETLTIGEHAFEVSHCPGHAPGHVVFHCEARRFAHVGDVLFSGSIGRTDLPGGDHDTLLNSIRTVLMTWPDETQFICGHGPGSTIGQERATNPFLR